MNFQKTLHFTVLKFVFCFLLLPALPLRQAGFTFYLHSQNSLYMPLNFQNAYDEGTRSYNGKPGQNYWQNNADYDIKAEVIPSTRIVSGIADIVYYNNSPDILDKMVFRLYQNINRGGNSRDFTFDDKYFTDGIIIKSLTINGKYYSPEDTLLRYTGTNLIAGGLTILPDEKASIIVSWEFEVPRENFIRMGAYDTAVFFIAYWYPQVAVYDDIFGWDMIEYTGGTEFYNDFNNYNVSITVPNNLGIWAAGDLLNPEKVLLPEIYSRFRSALSSETLTKIISASDYDEGKHVFNNDNSTNIWQFKAKGVPDFTFGLSDRYLWDGKSIFDGTKNVFVSAVYNPSSAQFYEVCEVASKTVEMLSKEIPGLPFPYPKITVFNGDGGVESPMMVNMGSSRERIWMVHTTVHEVVHTLFPFHMGINERRFAWMDEGWTQMLSEYIQYAIDTTIDFRWRNVKRYLDVAGSYDDLPIVYPSNMLGRKAYGNTSYFKPCNAYNTLKDILDGKEKGLFKQILQEFMNRWNGKHPSPYDFFFSFDDAAKENYDWFWETWFFNPGYPDLEIDSVTIHSGVIKILVEKEGILPVPVMLEVKASDGSVMNIYKSADIWKNSDDNVWIEETLDGKTVKSIKLGGIYIPDTDTTNNMWIAK